MKRLTLLFTVIAGCCVFGFGQTLPAPSPTPVEDEDVVKITTTLIQLDVTVTDKKGKPITGLKPEDFTISENGREQRVSGLSYISATRAAESREQGRKPADPLAPPPVLPVRPEAVRRTIALVVDDLTLSFESSYQTRRALKRFVDEQMQDGDMVAIVRTSAGVGALQQFTGDRRILNAAIEKVRWYPRGSGGISAFAPIGPTMLEQLQAMGDTSVSEEDLEREREFNQGFDDFRSSSFATGSLGALRFIVEGMGELPGRKSVILFSDGFRVMAKNNTELSGGGTVAAFMRKLIDVANRSSVVFYTIDPRGLVYTGFTAADDVVNPSIERTNRMLSERSSDLFETQAALRELARETGGFAVVNNNDIMGGVRRVMEDHSYYLLAYEPEDETFDPKKLRYNRIVIKVNRPDAVVRYRSGFFNVADENIRKPPAEEMTPQQRIGKALMSPFAVNDIELSMNALYANDDAKGNYIRTLLHINGNDLEFIREAEDKWVVRLGVVVANMDANGKVVEENGRSYTLSVPEHLLKKINSEGLVYNVSFPVKKPGAYQMRVAIVDERSGKVGSASQFMEIPNAKKKGRPSVSGIVLQGNTLAEWEAAELPGGEARELSDPMRDTSLRKFKRGMVLRYGYEVYQAALDASKRPKVNSRVRIFRNGKLVFEGEPKLLDLTGQSDLRRLKSTGALSLAEQMEPGEYVLQIVVKDEVAKDKYATATQFVQFEVVE